MDEMKIEVIEEHFMKLANPRNMFLVPLEIGGLGEIQEFIDEQRRFQLTTLIKLFNACTNTSTIFSKLISSETMR